jgi:hypothetical protein
MIKKGNGKYARPFDKDRIAAVSLIGTESWAEYGQVVLQMAILDTLLSIEEKLDRLAGGQPGKQDTPNLGPARRADHWVARAPRCTGGHTRWPGQPGEFHDCGHLGRWPGGRGWRVSSRWSPGALTDGARCLTLLRIGTRCFFAAPADTDEHFGGLMPKDRPDVVLGWGFVRDSLTSPALATAAGALPDTMMTDQAVTELRIQGCPGRTPRRCCNIRLSCRSPEMARLVSSGGGLRTVRDASAFRGGWRPIRGTGGRRYGWP